MNLLNFYSNYLFFIQIVIFIVYNFTTVESEEIVDDPDAKRNIIELIESRGFNVEVHYVTTQDSYILGVYRIINPFVSEDQRVKLRPVVLQHGLLSSGSTFLINSPDGFASPCDPVDQLLGSSNDYNDTHSNNLGFLLANRCYDVWLANSRGNRYSRNHTTLNPDKDREFWNFSFDEMIAYDTPNLIDYILNLTKFESLSWIGHSQGTLIMFGLLSEQPEYSLKVKPFIALAPVAYVANILPALRFASAIPGALWTLRKAGGELGESSPIIKTTSQFVCGRWQPKSCDNLVYPLEGYTLSMMNQSRIDVFRAHQKTAGTSVWNLVHFGQNVNSRQFIKFDYGMLENERRYNGPNPPKYTLTQINSTQIAILYGKADKLGDPQDVQKLVNKLKVPLFRDYQIPNPKWNHMDFIYADDLYQTVHTVILDLLRESYIKHKEQQSGQILK